MRLALREMRRRPGRFVVAVGMLTLLGVLLLLFEVGLESTVTELFSVGPSALLVATLGTGEDEHGTIIVLDRFALGEVERRIGGHGSRHR